MPSQKASITSSDYILGFKKDVFLQVLKWGAIAGAISGFIGYIGIVLTSLLSYAGVLGFFGGLFSALGLFNNLFWGAFWGILIAIATAAFHDKFPFSMFKTFFMKLFGVALIIDILTTLVFGGAILMLAGAMSFVVSTATFIIADFVYAKIVANKVGLAVGLR